MRGSPAGAPLLQRRHQRLAGISRVEAHGGLPAQMPLRPLQHLEDELQPAVRRVHLPLAQPQVQDVARLPRRRHDRMIHAPVIVAVPGAARLFPVDLHRQAVDVDDQRLRAPPPAHRLQPPPRQPLQPLAQHLGHPPSPTMPPPAATASAARAGARPCPAEPCPPGHRWPAATPDRPAAPWRRCAPGVPAPPAAEASAPAASANGGSGARPACPAALRQKPHHPAAPQQLAPRQRPRIPRDPVPAGTDPDRPVEAERRIHYLHLRRDGWRVLAILLTL